MTVEKELVSEIEAAVEQSVQDDKGFEEPEEKQEGVAVVTAEEKEVGPEEKQDESNEDDESGQKDDEEITGEIRKDESGGIVGEVGAGEEGDPEEAKAASGTAAAPIISEGVLELAVQSGLSVAEAKTFGNDQILLKAIQILRPISGTEKKEESTEQVLLLSDLPDLDPEQYEPEVIASFKKMKGAIQEQQKVLEQIVQETQASQANQATQNEREITAWFDGKVTGLGNDYEKTLGKGSHGSLDRGSSQYAKREEIADHISLMAAGYSSTGREVPPLDVLFDQAAKFVLQDEMNGKKEKQLSDRLRKRATQHINRAGSENVGTPKTAESSEAELASMIEKTFFKK